MASSDVRPKFEPPSPSLRTRFQNAFLIAALFLVVAAGTCLVIYNPWGGIIVTVKNAGGGEITNLQIKFTGGSKSSPKLGASEFFETRVNPASESDLVIEYEDSSGKKHSEKVDVYIEPNYKGVIHVTIEPDGKVTWKDDIKS